MSVSITTRNNVDHVSSSFFGDWFLPSKDELNAMDTELKLHSVGGFADAWYWSSSEYNAANAYAQQFTAGHMQQPYAKNLLTIYVRACRAFTSVSPSYSVRDTGPGGGLIFAIIGPTYLEAAPSDLLVTSVWSNINNVEIGITDTELGTGQTNTTAIINQVGHTDSAAKLCNDLVV